MKGREAEPVLLPCSRCGKMETAIVVDKVTLDTLQYDHHTVLDKGQHRLTIVCGSCAKKQMDEIKSREPDEPSPFWARIEKARELIELCGDRESAMEYIRMIDAEWIKEDPINEENLSR